MSNFSIEFYMELCRYAKARFQCEPNHNHEWIAIFGSISLSSHFIMFLVYFYYDVAESQS